MLWPARHLALADRSDRRRVVRALSVGIPSDLSIGNVGENLTLPRPSSAQIVPVDSTRRARSTHTRAGK